MIINFFAYIKRLWNGLTFQWILIVSRTDREYEEIVNQLSSSSSRHEETRPISIRDLKPFRPPPLRVTYDKAGIMAKLKESNLYPSIGYVKDGKLIGPPIGSVVPDTKVPLRKKQKYKERIQQLAQTSGKYSFGRLKGFVCIFVCTVEPDLIKLCTYCIPICQEV